MTYDYNRRNIQQNTDKTHYIGLPCTSHYENINECWKADN